MGRAGQSQAPLSCAAQGHPTSWVASARTLDRSNTIVLEAHHDIHLQWPKPCTSRAGRVQHAHASSRRRRIGGVQQSRCEDERRRWHSKRRLSIFQVQCRGASSQQPRSPRAAKCAPLPRGPSPVAASWHQHRARYLLARLQKSQCTTQVAARGRGGRVPSEGEDKSFSSVRRWRLGHRLRSNPSLKRRPSTAGCLARATEVVHDRSPGQGNRPLRAP